MIDKTMCEVLWRNISDFYVEVGKHPQVILAMYFNLDKNIPVNLWELLGGRSPPYQLF
jgi:hypothetical protein